ncbi:hypothetical protein JNB_07899 [Janibacter sp. HTCC2649]|uniref:hypothetical protein n=1 Tax=Janibacter sp. HTCC2649 TaxID=313589 RepID=UPI0000670D60|nr:hypothetical protein [Janibacter sp. HTCC2649]EAQ00077.1 hypothetical protein JNB_07899 [Janibacter sp. HTCC2649]
MPESIKEFAARAFAAQSEGGRLPLDGEGMPAWDVFPFEASDLRVKEVAPLGDEMPRMGEPAGPECWCRGGSDGGWAEVWADDNWHVKVAPPSGSPLILVLEPLEHVDLDELSAEQAGEFGIRTVALVRAIESLPSVGRCHVSRWGDGGSHAHVWFIARPLGMTQLRGTYMAVWDDLLPPVPVEVRDDNAAAAIAHLRQTLGG